MKHIAVAPTLQSRASGVLLHITSLPSTMPIGDLGPTAYAFVDELASAGQRWWQMLPVGPVGPGNSPYQALSAFAGNPLFLSLDDFVAKGWLTKGELLSPPGPADAVDFRLAQRIKEPLLRKAYERFLTGSNRRARKEFQRFLTREKNWVEDFALFSALAAAHPQHEWSAWPVGLRNRRARDLALARQQHRSEITFHLFLQWQFDEQWSRLHAHARRQGVGLIGDIPIFVAYHSADVWAHPELFQLKANGRPSVVAGVPPDYFSRTGQQWGNPHYRWPLLKTCHYRWWMDRLRKTFRAFDAARIDHFIGFVRYYAIPGDAETAENGRYQPGPGADFFRAVQKKFGRLSLIAEDLGKVTPEVKALRDQFQLPGMKVLQFAFGNDLEAENYQPHFYPPNSVVYTGTHDNDTTVGWFENRGVAVTTQSGAEMEKEKAFILRYLKSDGKEIHWDMIRAAFESPAHTAIVPMQDILGLGSEARMNRPGTAEGNWGWRMRKGYPLASHWKRLKHLTVASQRVAKKN